MDITLSLVVQRGTCAWGSVLCYCHPEIRELLPLNLCPVSVVLWDSGEPVGA